MKADDILKKHEDANEMHFHEVDRKWIIEAMEEYANQFKQLQQHSVMQGLLPKCPHCQGTGIDPTIPNYNPPPNSSPTVGNSADGKGVSDGDDFDPFYDEGEEAKWEDRDITY